MFRSLLIISYFNSLPTQKIVDQPKLKALADDKINMTRKLKYSMKRVENIVGRRENAGFQHAFSPLLTMFSKGLFHRVVISWDCVVKA